MTDEICAMLVCVQLYRISFTLPIEEKVWQCSSVDTV